ncbi:hypothetical protein FIL92_00325 [SAR202 cluster bacterium AD-812-D07_MRT_10900m]|nr:hypothetical protein [SAR202 cluster bacterium AD-812-D07_MRT_10900m]
MRVNVLTPGFTTSNGAAFLFPLVVHKNALRDLSIDVRLLPRSARDLTDCDVLAIDSKEFRSEWEDQQSETRDLISSYRHAGAKVIWFDTTDSTGTLQAPVLPVVDKYMKAQLLADTTRYTERVYGGRVHSEFYNRIAGIADDGVRALDEAISNDDLSKLGVSWNSGLANYSTFGPLRMGLYRRLPLARLLQYPGATEAPRSLRPNNLSARFGAGYNRATVRYQREKIRELLSREFDTQKLGRRGYIKELRRSKVVLSPFGWGEITLKDFEVFLTGGMLLKPSMDHMQTWPNFYEKHATYLPHAWDLSDLKERIEWAIENVSDRQAMAEEGQRRYIEHTSGPDAAEKFSKHLSEVLTI